MAVYGGQVQAINMTPDTRQSVAAARELAMTGAQGIAGMVGQVGDYFKKQKESKNLATMGLKIAEAAKIMDPSQALYYENIINTLKDENTPVDVRGALGAQVQDLLKQNTSMRAVAVQERQMGMRPSYMGGSEYAQSRMYPAGAPRTPGPQSASGQSSPLPDLTGGTLPQEDLPLVQNAPAGASINLDANKFNELLSTLSKVKNITPDENTKLVGDFADAIALGNEEGANQILSGMARSIQETARLYEKPTNASPEEIQTPSGAYEAYKTPSGNYVTSGGVIIDTNTGKPKQFNPVKPLTSEEINKSQQNLYGDGVLNPAPTTPLPEGYVPVETEETSSVPGIPTFEELTAMAQPQGGELYPIGSDTQPPADQPAAQTGEFAIVGQKGDPLRYARQFSPSIQPVAASDELAKKELTKRNEAKAARQKDEEELRGMTQLSPYQQNVVNDVLVDASQAGPTPNKQVTEEIKRNILLNRAFVPTGLPTEGVRIVSKEQKAKNNKALLSQAQGRVVDRSMAYELMKRFETIQQILNHPKAGELFGQSIPEEEIKKLSRDEGSIYALYENLKGQDLVSALRNIKEQSGTAAGMAASETKALQDAVNPLNTKQDWNSAKKTLMELSADTIRAGKRMGLTGVFSYVDPNDKSKGFKSSTLLNSTNEFDPIFEDEVDYFKKLDKVQSKLQGTTPAQPVQLSQPKLDPYGQAYQNLQQQNQRFFQK